MVNRYYILLDNRKVFGPYTIKMVITEQKQWEDIGRKTIILKEIIDINGKMVM